MKFIAASTMLATCLAMPLKAEEPWVVSLQAVSFQPANKSDAGPGLPTDAFSLNSKTIPEVSIRYFFLPHLAVEGVFSAPQQHQVTLDGVPIGSLKQVSPTLTGQWHFLPGEYVDPYVGAGLNIMLLSDLQRSGGPTGALTMSRPRVGATIQCGVDIQIAPGWVFNADARFLQIRSELKTGPSSATTVFMDPLLLSVGVGVRL